MVKQKAAQDKPMALELTTSFRLMELRYMNCLRNYHNHEKEHHQLVSDIILKDINLNAVRLEVFQVKIKSLSCASPSGTILYESKIATPIIDSTMPSFKGRIRRSYESRFSKSSLYPIVLTAKDRNPSVQEPIFRH